ncbi:MAG: hypothetical protein QE280_10655 [Caulobacter sp.]|nr:hypothetical protein [Caulobacter sp.]
MSRRSTLRLLLVASALGGLAFTAAPAMALPDAKVDQQIRPNFGGLITPPLKPRYRPDRWTPGRYTWGKRPRDRGASGTDYGPNELPPRDQMVAVVDCSDAEAGPTPISDTLQTVADNGILYIRGSAACKETVIIENPVVIAGEGASIFSGAAPEAATLSPEAGRACIRVAAGTRGVELRDLNLVTQQGGRMPCIEAWDAEVALVRTTVTYWGDTSAVYSSGGRMIMRDSVIDAKTWDAAVVAEGAVVDIARTRITGEAGGLDLTPGNGESRLDQVGVVARGGETPGDVGILVRGQRSGTGSMTMRDVVVCGWTSGLHLERGAQVDVARSRICDSQRGIISAGASLKVRESAIGAREVGAYVASGRASFSRNRFYGGGRPVYSDPGALVELIDNWVYSSVDCWRQQYEPGLYCVTDRYLPGPLRDRGDWGGGQRRGWDVDAYDRGYQRDGVPGALPREQPPKRGWGRRN